MKVFIFLTVSAAVLWVLPSCSFGTALDEEKITVELPAIPEKTREQLGINSWLLISYGPDGTPRQQTVSVKAEKVSLAFTKNALTPVLCYPLLNSEEQAFKDGMPPGSAKTPALKPAGAVYPVNAAGTHEKTLALSWQAGFSADFLRSLLAGSRPSYREAARAFSYFNWKRFQSETFKHENPWLLDCEKLFFAVLNEKLTVYSFKEQPRTERKIEFGQPDGFLYSTYVPEGSAAGETEDGKTAYTCPLTAGVNMFISPQHIVYINEEKSTGILAISAIRR